MAAKSGGRRKVGRPPKSIEDRQRNRLTVTLTDAELGKLQELAEASGQPIGTVAREILARSLRRRK